MAGGNDRVTGDQSAFWNVLLQTRPEIKCLALIALVDGN